MSDIYHDGSRQLQDEFDTRRLADRLDEAIVQDSILPSDRQFIERLDMFFIATVDERGHVNCSYKAGEPGFVRVLDERTLAFPNYDGNGMYLTMGNILRTRQVGMLFIDFESRRRVRINGRAHVVEADVEGEYAPESPWPLAERCVQVTVEQVYGNCRARIPRMKVLAPSDGDFQDE